MGTKRELGDHAAAQLMHVERAGVDDGIGLRTQRFGQLALAGDRFRQRQAEMAERVAAAGIGIPLDQRLVAGFEKQQSRLDAVFLRSLAPLRQLGQVATAAHIDAHRQALVADRVATQTALTKSGSSSTGRLSEQ